MEDNEIEKQIEPIDPTLWIKRIQDKMREHNA